MKSHLRIAFACCVAAAIVTQVVRAPATAAITTLTRTISHDGRSFTLELQRVSVRAPGYVVLVQKADGSLRKVTAPAPQTYLGSVRGVSSAMAAGVIDPRGRFDGQLVFDRGQTWLIEGGEVDEVRGGKGSFHWPNAANTSLNATVGAGQAGRTTYRWDVGYDVLYPWFDDAGTVNRSIHEAVSLLDRTTVELLLAYQSNALLRPAVKRVVIRAAQAQDPYAGADSRLSVARAQWQPQLSGDVVDTVGVLTGVDGGSGVAYIGATGSTWGAAISGGTGTTNIVLRHEFGHNWDVHDNHTNGPEGATINSGNALARWDGTEVRSMLAYRDSLLDSGSRLTPTARFGIPLPPYAALDLVDAARSGAPRWVRPLRNDFDANGDGLTLVSVGSRSNLGGKVVRDGNTFTYIPPAVPGSKTLDRVSYVVRDASGKTATGVVMFRVSP